MTKEERILEIRKEIEDIHADTHTCWVSQDLLILLHEELDELLGDIDCDTSPV